MKAFSEPPATKIRPMFLICPRSPVQLTATSPVPQAESSMRLKSLAGRISVHGNLEDDKNLYRELTPNTTEGGCAL